MTRSVPIYLVPCLECCVISAELRRSMRRQSMLRADVLLLSARQGLASPPWLRPLPGTDMRSSATTSVSCNSELREMYRRGPALAESGYGRTRGLPWDLTTLAL